MNETQKEKIERNRLERNRLVLAVFVALCAGFLLAIMFGALPDAALKTDEWVAVAVSLGAAVISGVAVMLVHRNLITTQDILNDQRRTNQLQTRPWLLFSKQEVIIKNTAFYVKFTIKNFGNLPAKDVSARITQEITTTARTGSEAKRVALNFNEGNKEPITSISTAIPPNGKITISSPLIPLALTDEGCLITFTVKYKYNNAISDWKHPSMNEVICIALASKTQHEGPEISVRLSNGKNIKLTTGLNFDTDNQIKVILISNKPSN